MKNQKCVKCGHKLSYKEKLLGCFKHNYVPCKVCGTKSYIEVKSKVVFLLLLFVPNIFNSLHPSHPLRIIGHPALSIGLFLIYCIVLLLLYPLFFHFNSVKSLEENK